MKEIPIPSCNNNNRTTMKCRRMCCRRIKPKVEDKTRQTRLFAPRPVMVDLEKLREQIRIGSDLIYQERRNRQRRSLE